MEKEKMDKKNKNDVNLGRLLEYAIDLTNSDEILEREVVGIGNGAHINIPLKHLGKKARVIIQLNKIGG